MSSAKQIIKNTGFLYMKMIISIFIALYSTRLVLNALGADDFGSGTEYAAETLFKYFLKTI